MKKILIVFGTRPEAIKMAPLVNKLLQQKKFITKVCVTAQHREMLDQVLTFFNIIPDYDLDVMITRQTLHQLSAKILTAIEPVLQEVNPDIVLVHGDTTTSSMVALAAFYKNIKVGHVEAGLRTYNKQAPFPEEINRQITSKIADIHFAPTKKAYRNLVQENIPKNSIHITGNTVIDALFWGIKHVNLDKKEINLIKSFTNKNKKLIVVTGHRRENFGGKFIDFCNALAQISKRDDVQLIYPVHLNPEVQNTVYKILDNYKNILLIQPLDYESFIWLLHQSYFIITDSGGIQEEAPSLKKPVLVTRDITERQEALDEGVVKLVGTDKTKIIKYANLLLDDKQAYNKMVKKKNIYGDGKASSRIIKVLTSF